MLNYLLDFVLGIGIGFIAGLLGVGGGFLIVPTLVLLGEPIHIAIGTSLACITISALSAAYTHLRRGAVLFKVVLLKEAFSVPFALIGAYISSMVPERTLRIIFALLLFYLAYSLMKAKAECRSNGEHEIKYGRVPAVGALAGLTSGLLGISGGILNVPLFHTYVGIPMRYAIGTSSLALFFTALAASIEHYRLGQVDLYTALLLAPGLILGARIGALTAHRVEPSILRKVFAVLLLVVVLRMIL
jgi:uncharacterized membrane protein YfcA